MHMTDGREHNDRPGSFYTSPEEAARAAPPEELLYLACLHRGTGVDAPDFLAVVDAEEGRVVHETPMPNVGDELHHFGWNAAAVCHAAPTGRTWWCPASARRDSHPGRATIPAGRWIETVIEPEEIVAKHRPPRRTPCTACRATRS